MTDKPISEEAVDVLEEVAEAMYAVIKPEPGDVIILRKEDADLLQLRRLAKFLASIADGPVYVLNLKPGDEIEFIDEEAFAMLARARGYYKAVPDH